MSLIDLWIDAVTSMNNNASGFEQLKQDACQKVGRIVDTLEEEFLNLSSSFSGLDSTLASPSMQKDKMKLDHLYYSVKPEVESQYVGSSEASNMMVDNIVSARVEVFNLAKHAGPADANWTSIKNEIEELEARALTVLTLPSTLFDDTNETELILKRIESQAVLCFEKAQDLVKAGPTKPIPTCPTPISTKSTTDDSFTDIRSTKLPSLKIFPTFDQARSLQAKSTDLLYPLLADYSFRPVTMKIKRMISCACSQISRHDPKHSLDRLNYILTILNGQGLKDLDLDEFNSNRVPTELLTSYAWQCLYSASLSQAEFQFSHNIDSAFVFASLLSGIFALHPDRLTEFLGRLFLACPGLGLFVDPTNGVKLMNEMLSNSDILSRWRGISRLFASLLLAHPPPSLKTSRPSYLNPAFLWTVVVGILNQKFVPCGSAEILHGLLEVGGGLLIEFYGNQAQRLIGTIKSIINSSSELRLSSPEIALLSAIESATDKGPAKFPGGFGFLGVDFWAVA